MQIKKIMVLGAGVVQVPIIEKVKSLNYFCIAIDMDSNAPGMKIADLALPISSSNYSEILNVAKEHKIDGILTTSDFPVNSVALVGEKLKLPAMSSVTAAICTNKFSQREFFKNNDINHPSYQLFSSVDEISNLENFPYIIKPVSSSGSRGVFMVNNLEDLKEKLDKVKEYSMENSILIEDYVGGREFSIETLTQNNLTSIIAITEKITKGEKFGTFVEDLHLIPARITAVENDIIRSEVLKVISKLGLNDCPSHTEIKLFNNKVYIIEIACRLGGDFITSDLVPLHNGLDMLDNLVRLCLGEKINISETISKVSCIQFINTDNYGNCKKFIESKSQFMIKSNIEAYHSDPILNSNQRMGYIILQANSNYQIERVLNQLNKTK
jgi:carbamoyl-phosphate synthase large subunit